MTDEPTADEMRGDETWGRLATAAEDEHWQHGTATIGLKVTGGGANAWLDVGEVRVLVDGQPALLLAGQQLATLAH